MNQHSYCAIDTGCHCATCKHDLEDNTCCVNGPNYDRKCEDSCPEYEPEDKEG